MKIKFFVILILAIVVAVFTAVFLLQEKPQKKEGGNQSSSQEKTPKAWIDVVKPAASELKKESELEVRRLLTGDELEKGAVVKTDKTGFGDIYFPGGSVLRLDSETKVTMEEESFNPQSKKLTAKIILAGGRVWSKVLELATPDSLWEVKTSNTVATVRGTAFSVEYLKGKTKITGSEGEVLVAILDPQTGKIIKDSQVIIAPDKFIEIRDEDIESIKKNPEITADKVKDVPKEILRGNWLKRAIEADKEIEKLLQENPENLDKALKEEKIEKAAEPARTTEEQTSPKIASPSVQPETETTTAKPIQLLLTTENNLSQIEEGMRIYFKAVLVMENNEKRDVTDLSAWQVLGGIGIMEKPGVFLAKLDSSIAEYGQGLGTVIAVWKDEKSGASFLAKSPVLNVKAKTEQIIEERE